MNIYVVKLLSLNTLSSVMFLLENLRLMNPVMSLPVFEEFTEPGMVCIIFVELLRYVLVCLPMLFVVFVAYIS